MLTLKVDNTSLPAPHKAIIEGSAPSEIRELLFKSARDTKNSLSQTALHVAAMYALQTMEVLVEAGYRLDETDRFGVTPFAWACSHAYSFDGEALATVIKAAIDTGTYDPQAICEMWAHVMERSAEECQLTPLLMGVQYFQRVGFHAFTRDLCCQALGRFMDRDADHGSGSSKYEPQISKLLSIVLSDALVCEELTIIKNDLNLRFSDTFWLVTEEKWLRHAPCRVEDHLIQRLRLGSHVTALIKHGLDLAKYVDHFQRNAFYLFVQSVYLDPEASVIRALLACGVDPNHQDHRGHTPLHLFLRYTRRRRHGLLAQAKTLSKLIANGACPTIRDKCRCACAPNGCLATWMEIRLSGRELPLRAILQLSVVEFHSSHMAREVVLELIRRAKHELFGIPHWCCTRKSKEPFDFAAHLPSDDIDEIWKDEEDHIRNLDLEMELHNEEVLEDLIEHWYHLILTSWRRRQAKIEQKV